MSKIFDDRTGPIPYFRFNDNRNLRRNPTLDIDNEILVQVQRKLLCTLIVRCIVCGGEIAGGFIAGSLAVIADGAEKFSDMVYLSVSLISVRLSLKEATDQYSYGYYRAGVIGALLSAMVMWIIAGILSYSAILRIINIEDEDIDAHLMLYTAGAGLVINLIVMVILHSNEVGVEEAGPKNENLKAVILDILGDTVQSVLTITASLLIWFWPEKFKLADPICSLTFPIICFFVTRPIIKECVNTLMEGCPADLDPVKIKEELLTVPNIKKVTDIHIWSISNGKSSISLRMRATQLGSKTVNMVKNKCIELGIVHTTIQLEECDGYESPNNA